MVTDWIAENALAKATQIASTTESDIRKAISVGASEGQGSKEVAKQIRKVGLLSAFRAATIARTETHGASNYAFEQVGIQAEAELGVTLRKFWVPALDERTRIAHADMARVDGIKLNESFTVGGELMSRPGDPNGSASNVINCRCRLVHRDIEFDLM